MKRVFLLLIMLAALALGARDPDPKAVIGKIDDVVYSYADYNKILSNYFSYHQNQKGRVLTEEEKAELNNRCWEELVGRYIYDKAIKAGKIKITRQELMREAKKNPPAAVKQIPDLQKKGRFDQKTYEKALSEASEFREAVLDEVRALYQYNKLLDAIRSEAVVTEDSVRVQWERDSEVVDAKIIFFDANRQTNVVPTEEEARAYFQERIEEFRKDDCRRYRYVRFAKVASPEDSLAAEERAWQLYRELQSGADFAELAREHSQDPGSAANGGDLGWFGRGRMVAVFEAAAFNTPIGEISEPLLSNFGWHIIQTRDRRDTEAGEEVSAGHILIRPEPSMATQQLMKAQSAQLFQLASDIGLARAAGEMGLQVEESAVFQGGDAFIGGIGRDPGLVSFAFANPEGALADMFFAPSGDIYVCEISGVYPVYYPSFEEERARVMSSASSAKRGYLMNAKVQNFVSNLKPEQYLDWAERDSIMVVEITDHRKGDNISSIGKVPALESALFNTPEGSFAPLISEPMRWFLVKVERHQLPDPAVWERDRQKLLAEARETARQEHLNEWYRQERQKISIIDNRRDYYDLSSTGKVIKL
ncbi:MAG: peptidylprolyl isomerase [Candidatus Cloacimonetes bacterium]|nr:peptidylprolyl isomerase [Candidatus Cloacimonadota bacterium]